MNEKEGFDHLVQTFFGRVHDMKNSINCIGGFADCLKDMVSDKNPDPVKIARFSDIILNNAKKIDNSIHDILSFANDEPQKTLVDITELIMEEINSVSAMAGDIGIFFDQKKNCLLYVDRRQIGSVIKELLHNAVCASKENGGKEIMIRTYFYDDPIKERHSLCIKIRNHGHVPEKDLERIFQFSFTTKTKGSGIGLTAARKAVEMHGGKIKCRNENDMVVFQIFLPRNIE